MALDAQGAPILRYDLQEPQVGMTGGVASMAMFAGQGVGLTSTLNPLAKIIAEMVAEANSVLSRLSGP